MELPITPTVGFINEKGTNHAKIIKPTIKTVKGWEDFTIRIPTALRSCERLQGRIGGCRSIPEWTPYELRHSAASAISVGLGGEAATSQLGHTSPTTTAIYLYREIEKLTKLVLERENHNPFMAM